MTSFHGCWRTRGHLREVSGAARSGARTRAADREVVPAQVVGLLWANETAADDAN
jgi:hypothetical protein